MPKENRDHGELQHIQAEHGTVSDDAPLYTARFFQVFLAILLFMTGVALQFHFGQYVAFVGYGPQTLGWILAVSVVGSLLVRLQVGGWVDRFGCRPTWLVGTLMVAASVAAIQFTQQIWLITLLRAVWALAACLVLTTVAVFAAQVAPPQRRAESIGMLGLAGLLGIMVGPTMGDWIFADAAPDIFAFRVFFTTSAVFALASGVVILQVQMPGGGGSSEMRGVSTEMRGAVAGGRFGRLRGQLRLIREHWPGSVLLVGLVFSTVFCLQSSFLERLAEERGFHNVKVFFLVYSPTAIVLRVMFRRLPQQIGRSRTLVIGLLAMTVGLVLLIKVQSQWQLVLPGMFMGMGHCFVFPSMVDLAAGRFPMEHRGTATSLILGAGDVGMIIGYASMGELVERWGFSTTLELLAALVFANTVLFSYLRRDAILGRRRVKRSYFDPPGSLKSASTERPPRA